MGCGVEGSNVGEGTAGTEGKGGLGGLSFSPNGSMLLSVAILTGARGWPE